MAQSSVINILAVTDGVDWQHLIEVVAIAITAILSAWNKISSSKRSKQVSDIKTIVTGTEAVVNSQKEATLKTGLVAAKALAATAPTGEHIELANEASRQLQRHLEEQAAKEFAKTESKKS